LWLMLIGWFLYTAAQTSYQQSTLQESLSGIKVKDIMVRDIVSLSPLPGRGPGGATMNRLGKTMRVVETRRRQSACVSGEAKGAEREAGRIMDFSLGVRDRRVPTGRAAPHLDLGVSHHRANVVSEPLGYQTRPRIGSPTYWRSLHVGA